MLIDTHDFRRRHTCDKQKMEALQWVSRDVAADDYER